MLIVAVVAVLALVFFGFAVMIAKFYRKVDQGRALIINKMKKEPEVTFTGGTVYPIIHRAEVMDISLKTVDLERLGKDGLICADNIRADIRVTFFVRVNKTRQDVLKVAQAIGCARASDQSTLEQLFIAKFSEALKTVGKKMEFERLYTQRDDFKDELLNVIGKDLNGYVLDDAAIDYLEQTPLDSLDPNNILDAQGIRKITELTTVQRVATTELDVAQNVKINEQRQKERMEVGKQNLESQEAIFNYEQQQSEAEAKKAKNIAMAETREQNEAMRLKHEEDKRTALTRKKAEEEVLIADQNKHRAVEVATKAREREVQVETIRIKKAMDLEEVSRERDVDLRRIDKQKALEVERKAIADVVRQRIAVEKTVAEEEERIKDLRAGAEARRDKEVLIITAEAEAQEKLVKNIKEAEAQEEVAKFNARERLTRAEADLEAADKEARAKMRMSEGVQAEQAAQGLAQVRVTEARAVALEKTGLAEARITQEKMSAEAQGSEKKGMVVVSIREAQAAAALKEGQAEAEVNEKKGMAAVSVREAQAAAALKEGQSEAQVIKQKKLAEAAGAQELGLAQIRIKEADAEVVEKRGIAEAVAIEKKLSAEANGLAEKAEAMKALDGVGREHEEFRLRLDMERQVALDSVQARIQIAEHQAQVMGAAFDQAKINIVGGDGQFFDRFINAVSMGQTTDALLDNSETAQQLLKGYMEGEESLPADLKEILAGKLTAENLKNLSLTAFLSQLSVKAEGKTRTKLNALIHRAKELGLDQLS